tara:strand:+ start:1228 stop:1422 length:195 start_codon:yes stop_codon:yes gene_type:complete
MSCNRCNLEDNIWLLAGDLLVDGIVKYEGDDEGWMLKREELATNLLDEQKDKPDHADDCRLRKP